MLIRMNSIVGMMLLTIALEREMFYKRFRCDIMIDGNTFQANMYVRIVKGS